MLPLYRTSSRPQQSARSKWTGRPMARWIGATLTFAFLCYVFASSLLPGPWIGPPLHHFGRPPPPDSHFGLPTHVSLGHPGHGFIPGSNISRPMHGPYPPPPNAHGGTASESLWTQRAGQVRDAYLHAYHGYQTYAGEYDELRPLSNDAVNK